MIQIAKNSTACLALGGGGARGLAHLGVIEELRKMPITIERFVGVSIGSLAGALCALDSDTSHVSENVMTYLTSEVFQTKQAALFATAPDAEEPSTAGLFAWYHQIRKFLGARKRLVSLFRKSSLLDAQVIQDIVDALIPDIDIRDLETPLSIVALDLYSGKRIVLTEGPLRKAIMASAAIPGVFPPVKWGSMLLCDIGMMDAIPSRIAKTYGADFTIAVDVGSRVEPICSCVTATEIFLRLSDIGEPLVRDYTTQIADLVVRPPVATTKWYDFTNPAELVEHGRQSLVSLGNDWIQTSSRRRTSAPTRHINRISCVESTE